MTLAITVPSSDTEISTHTLTWSVTEPPASTSMFRRISTHTLTWSVTASKAPDAKSREDFNSHAHVERDTMLVRLLVQARKFQLTRSRGA